MAEGPTQREGKGLLEHQAVPSLRDVAHDGVLCTFSNTSAPDQAVWPVRAGGMQDRPSGHSPPASQAGRRVGPVL